MEFNGDLYAGIIKAGSAGVGDIYKKNFNWNMELSRLPSVSCGQVWGMSVYNNVMYIGCTTSGGATIYKSNDGFNFVQDFQVPNVNETEAFNMINYNGSLYVGLGFGGTHFSGDIYSEKQNL